MAALFERADCYVSLHRSEGYGLTLAESMALGKPVIATGYSGNTDFMTPANSYLVDWALTEVGPEAEHYPEEGIWAEPSLEHAAALMREVYGDREAAAARGARAAADIAAWLTPEAVGAIARKRLVRIGRRRRGAPPAAAAAPLPGADFEHRLEFDLGGGDRGGPKGAARRALFRAPAAVHRVRAGARPRARRSAAAARARAAHATARPGRASRRASRAGSTRSASAGGADPRPGGPARPPRRPGDDGGGARPARRRGPAPAARADARRARGAVHGRRGPQRLRGRARRARARLPPRRRGRAGRRGVPPLRGGLPRLARARRRADRALRRAARGSRPRARRGLRAGRAARAR